MGDTISDVLELIVRFLKRLGIWLFQTLFESVIEAIFELAMWIVDRQHQFYRRHLNSKWLYIPLSLLTSLVLLGTPCALLVFVLGRFGF